MSSVVIEKLVNIPKPKRVRRKKIDVVVHEEQSVSKMPNKRTNKRRQVSNPSLSRSITSGGSMTYLRNKAPGNVSSKLLTEYRDNQRVQLDPYSLSWFFKYLDPAGSVETARVMGDFGKVPDGLLQTSVDAEIRTIENLFYPDLDETSNLPLDGSVWSVTIISLPCFRTNFIAVASRLNNDISDTIAGDLCEALNNLENFRLVIDTDMWVPFSTGNQWYYRIFTLPPNYDAPDPIGSTAKTIESYRMTYKSLTIMSNTPTLIDQGFWAGGHVAIDSNIVAQETIQSTEIPSWITIRNYSPSGSPFVFPFTFVISNVPQIQPVDPAGIIVSPSASQFFWTFNTTFTGSFVVPSGISLFSTYEQIFATTDDVVVITRVGNTVTVSSNHTPVVNDIIIEIPNSNPLVSATSKIFVNNDNLVIPSASALAINLPAYRTSQIAANNPRMETFLTKDSEGAYLVHKKNRNPVFSLTSASTYGPLQFNAPGYDINRNHNNGTGIYDTWDQNFSTGVVVFKGISHAFNPVVKTYYGWEGQANLNTPFGQFGHSGASKCEELLDLADTLQTNSDGVYPAKDNFLGSIATWAASKLGSLLASNATKRVVSNIASDAMNRAGGWFQRIVKNKRSQQ